MKIFCSVIFIFFATILSAQEKEIEIFNTSINTSDAEFGITYFNTNIVIFASSKKIESDKNFSKSRRKTNQQLFLDLYQGIVSENGDIIETGKFSNELDSKFFESDISFTPDGKTIYFTWNNFYNTQSRKDSAKWKSLQLMKASINERFEISNIRYLPFNSEAYSVRYPEVSKDGKQLFFASDMPNGFGGTDIYVVDIFNNDTFSKPKNLGETINTKEDEIFPFIDKNNTIYFASNGHKGMGGFDVFKSKFENGNFLPSENLPSPINSKYDDFAYVINNTNNYGFLTSNRIDSKGGVDIYAFKIKDKECLQTIAGLVFNEKDNQQISKVNVSLFVDNELIETKLTALDSKFNFKVKCDTSYKIIVKKEGFISSEIDFMTDSNIGFVNNKDIILTPIECSHTVSGYVLNEVGKNQLIQAKVSLFVNNELKETQLTKLGLKFNFFVNCEDTYKIVAEKSGFLSSEVTLITDNRPYFLIDENIILTPEECKQTIAGFVFNEKDNKQLDQAKVSLFIYGVLTDTQITQGDSKFNFIVNCNSSIKIIAEKDDFLPSEVTLLSDDRQDNFIENNIVLTPIECIQTISGYILNEKDNQQLTETKVSLFINNELKESQFTKVDTKFNFKLACDTSYKIIAEKEGFTPSKFEIITDDKLNFLNEKNIVLIPVECIQTISGFVLNEKDNQQLTETKVSLFINNELKETQLTKVDSKFNFKVGCDTSYKIMAEKEGFTPSEVEIATDKKLNFSNDKNIVLVPIECIQTISGFVYNQQNNKQLTETKVSLFINNELKETQLTKVDSKFSFKVACDTSYKIMAEKEGFISSEVEIATDKKLNFSNEKNIVLEPIECIQTISGYVLNEKDNQQLTETKVSLFINNELKETQLTKVDSKFNFKVACDTSYKIIAEKEDFTPSEVEIITDDKLNFSNEKNIVLTPIECIQTISGYVYNQQNNKQIAQTKVSLFINNELKESQLTKVDSKFNFKVACDTSYKIIAEKEGFISSEVEVITDHKLNFSNEKNIILEPVECNVLISGTILDIKTKKPVSNAIVQIFKQDILVDNLKLDANAKFNIEVECKSEYKIITSLKKYENKITYFQTSIINNDKLFKVIFLEPLEEFVFKYNQKMIKTDVIYFDLDSDEISTDAAIEINKVIGVLISYPTMKIEVGSHTDSRAPDDYNLILSEKRANAVIQYMVLNGIDANRLVAKGYGETQLVNKCSNGVNCSNADHELNRRTEFKILEE